MARRNLFTARLMAGASLGLIGLLAAGSVFAESGNTSTTGTGAEGTEVSDVIVTAERNQAAAMAPAKASLEQTQPEAIISRAYIEQATPETGGWTTVVTIAPSMSGINTNGGGIGDYNKVTMRGFQDGQFNITYDGISFGDTNDPTHHSADYWPASTIGAAVVDRGPGAAGDLGQANFGGAIHFFSPDVSSSFGLSQKLTYGSFNTEAAVTTLNTGPLKELGGGRLLVNLDERASGGELSHSGGNQFNQMFKFVLPIGNNFTLTAFGAHEWTKFYLPDAGPGETWAQVQAYGKNFQLNNTPTDEHYYKYNYERKQTDFEYIDLKYQVTANTALEDQAYTYFYSNKTIAADGITGLVGAKNTSAPNNASLPSTDIGGYDKLNDYRVYGNVVRFSQQWGFGTLKLGGIVETSGTDRHNYLEDFTQGFIPDNKFLYPKYYRTTNDKLLEHSNWLQGQIFVDFDWRPIDNLTVSPGFKFVDFTRKVDAQDENVAGGKKNQPLHAKNTYTSPLYFLTTNYKIRPDWAVYGQFATSFLIPSLSALYATGADLQGLKPETTNTYQLGTVYTHGNITADADVYWIDAANLYVSCGTGVNSSFCNLGKARYSGVEGEVAYSFPFGVTLFGNGSLNDAHQFANAPNLANGISGNAAGTIPNAPEWTAAVGAILHHGSWQASMTYKQSGAFVAGYNSAHNAYKLPGYDTIDASLAYDFGHFKLKVQGFNLADKRSITGFTPASSASILKSATDSNNAADTSLYTFQAGRELSVTLEAKF